MNMLRILLVSVSIFACRTTQPATHVEIVSEGGGRTYVGGAAGPGVGQTKACKTAVARAVDAIALRVSQKHSGLGDKVAEEVGATDGAAFIHGYVRHTSGGSSVQDVQFDPTAHRCLATVRWKEPVFLKDALLKYAQDVKERELNE